MKPILPSCIAVLGLAFATAQDIDSGRDESAPAFEGEVATPADEPGADEASHDSASEEAGQAENESDDASADDSAGSTDDNADDSLNDSATTEEVPESAEEPAEPEHHEAAAAIANEDAAERLEEQPTPPEPGMAVRVERIQGSHTAVDPATVKLRAPFPAKLLAQVPEGWRIEKSDRAPAFSREVELAPGSRITLSVQPHVLIPEADGASGFAVPEPGYEAGLGYRQNATVGAILATSIRQLEDDSLHLGAAIDQLQQLLVSLPQPEPAPQEQPAPKRIR